MLHMHALAQARPTMLYILLVNELEKPKWKIKKKEFVFLDSNRRCPRQHASALPTTVKRGRKAGRGTGNEAS